MLDDDGSLAVLVCLVHQQKPLFIRRRTTFRVDLVAAGIEPCSRRDELRQEIVSKSFFCMDSTELPVVQP